eukprot:SAG11_NODE_19469_length_466_cov_0.465940_1_plen_62_part_00
MAQLSGQHMETADVHPAEQLKVVELRAALDTLVRRQQRCCTGMLYRWTTAAKFSGTNACSH